MLWFLNVEWGNEGWRWTRGCRRSSRSSAHVNTSIVVVYKPISKIENLVTLVLSVEFIQTNVFYLLILIVYLVDMQRYHSPFSLTPPLAPDHRNNNCSSLVSSFIYMYIYYAYIPTESILPVQFFFLFSRFLARNQAINHPNGTNTMLSFSYND